MSDTSSNTIRDLLRNFVNAPTWSASRQILIGHQALLLTDAADADFAALIADQTTSNEAANTQMLVWYHDLLQRCRAAGINAAFDHLAAVSLKHNLRNWDAISRKEKFSFETGILTGANRLRPLLDSGQYLAVECPGFAQSEKLSQTSTTSPAPPECGHRQDGVLSFERAVAVGREQLDFELRPFEFALDIAILHNRWGIKSVPLPPATHTTNITAHKGGIAVNKFYGTINQYNNSPSDEE